MTVRNDADHGGAGIDDGPTGREAEPGVPAPVEDVTDDDADHPVDDLVEDEEADPAGVVVDTDPKHEQKFRWWALGVIAGLCVFFALSTLLVAALATGEAAGQVASDMAKTAIPTLLTLLGTAVAWAFKSEKD